MRKAGLAFFLMGAWFAHGGCSSEDGEGPPKLVPDASAGTAGAASGSSGAAGSGGNSGATGGGSGGATSGGSSGASSGGNAGTSNGGAGATSSGGSGGAVGSSGAGAQGGTDAGTGGSAGSGDPCQGARLCETFESYAAGGPPGGNWELNTNRGAVSIVEDQKFRGARSVRLTTEANSGAKTAFIRNDSAAVFPVPGNAYFGRMMFRLESAPDTAVHWTFIQSAGVVAGQTYRSIYRYGGQHPVTQSGSFVGNQLMANYETSGGPSSDCWHHANRKVVPVGRWACAEWQFDGPNNTLRFWLDGQALDDLTVAGRGQGCVSQPATFAWTAPNFANLEIGWESYQNDVARTLYIDDVVIHTQKVGCPAPP